MRFMSEDEILTSVPIFQHYDKKGRKALLTDDKRCKQTGVRCQFCGGVFANGHSLQDHAMFCDAKADALRKRVV